MQTANQQTPARLERPAAVAARVGISKSELWRRVRQDESFPKPVKLGPQTTAFIGSEVDRWIADRIAAARTTA